MNETIQRKSVGEALGIAMIRKPIINRNQGYMGGIELYEGKLLDVMDRNDAGDCLVMSSAGLGNILAEDIVEFVPVVKKKGVIMPSNITILEEFLWFNKAVEEGIGKFNNRFIFHCIEKQTVDKNFINL
jgi:hypothetical protein